MRFFSSYAILLILALAGVVRPVSQIPPNTGNSATGLPSLPPNAQRAILATLSKDNSAGPQQAELTASDGAANDEFGYSVAASGSTVVVGAPNHEVGSNGWQGAAYVFVQNGTTWTQQAELTASDGAALGFVAVSGNTVVVGADCYPASPTSCGPGAAYVFAESGGTWSQQAELTASDGAAGDFFGNSVAVEGSMALVGALYHTVGSNADQGAAYVFVESGGTWIQQAELTSSDGAALDYFGGSVALDGGTAVVGAFYHQALGPGAAYVFAESGGTWSQQAELTASGGANEDFFGYSVVAIDGTVVVGGPNHAVGSKGGQGAAYVYTGSGSTWIQQAELTASHGAANDFFGVVAASGSTVVVGADCHPASPTSCGPGAAYVFVPGMPAVTLSPTSLSFGNEAVNDTSAAKTVTLKNTGVGTLDMSSIAPTGDFAVYSTTCGATLAAGEKCQVGVTFTPTQLGKLTGTLSFTDNTSGSPQTVALSGTGIGSPPSYTLSASPSSLSVAQGSQGTSTITITPVNAFSGSVTLTASGLPNRVTSVFNPNPATSTSTLTLTASGTATTGTATVTVTGTSGSLTETTTLTLTVTPAQPVGVVSPTSLNFGSVLVGTTSTEKVVALENTGNGNMVVSSVSVSGPFAVAVNKCQNGVKVGTHCNVWVTYTPQGVENDTGTLTFTDNASNSPQSVSLSGTGIAGSTK